MPKIVVLGSCRYEPYEVLAMPKRTTVPGLYNTEEGYKKACERFYPAINEADVVIVYNPEGKVGEHTQRDIDYAVSKGAHIVYTHSKSYDYVIGCELCGFKIKYQTTDEDENEILSSDCETRTLCATLAAHILNGSGHGSCALELHIDKRKYISVKRIC